MAERSLSYYKKEAEVEAAKADQAEEKLSRTQKFYRNQMARKNELMEAVVNTGLTIGTAGGMRAIRHNVDLEVFDGALDVGGAVAFVGLSAGILGYGGKYNSELLSISGGVGAEYLIHKIDKHYEGGNAGGVDEDTGGSYRDRRRDRRDERDDRPRNRRDAFNDLRPQKTNKPPIYVQAEVIDAK